MAEKRRLTRLGLATECEAEMLRSLELAGQFGAEWLKRKAEIKAEFGPVSRARTATDHVMVDSMSSWKWHAENVRVQSAAIVALMSLQEHRIAEYERGLNAQRRNDPKVFGQREPINPDPSTG